MNSKRTSKLSAAILIAGISAIGAIPASAVIDPTFDNSDLILGFVSSSVSTNLEINLGAPILFKNANSNILIGNIGSQLTSLFGASWFDDANLLFGVSGANNSTSVSPGTANANGDFNSTVYASRAREGNGTVGSANSTTWSISNTLVSGVAGSMVSQGGTFNSFQTGGVATIANSTVNDWSDFNPTAVGTVTAYNQFTGINGIQFRVDTGLFDSGNYGGLTNVEGVVDLYRMSRFSNGGLTPGVGSYIGSFAIEQDGDVFYVVPEPGSAALLGIGLAFLAGYRGRRRLHA
jgi:PEP-CTERM motif